MNYPGEIAEVNVISATTANYYVNALNETRHEKRK